MKIFIYTDESYPSYTILFTNMEPCKEGMYENKYLKELEVDEETVARWNKIIHEYGNITEEITKAIEAKEK